MSHTYMLVGQWAIRPNKEVFIVESLDVVALPDTQVYRDAGWNRGELAGWWQDKPHQVLWDLCKKIEEL